jgi:hypothetical protein
VIMRLALGFAIGFAASVAALAALAEIEVGP